jgi:hypothetical protein
MSKSLLKRPRRAPAILAAERSTRTGLKRPRGTLSAVPLDLIVRGKRFLRRINPIGETGDGERSFSGARSELPAPRRHHDGFAHMAASPTTEDVSAGPARLYHNSKLATHQLTCSTSMNYVCH